MTPHSSFGTDKESSKKKSLKTQGSNNIRISRALQWRLKAFQNDPKLKNLVRPTPITRQPRINPEDNTAIGTKKTGASKVKAHTSAAGPKKKKEQDAKESQYRFKWGGSFFDAPIRENVVFYESFAGNGTLCNPLAIFEHLLNDPTKRDLEHVWSVRTNDEMRRFNVEYARFSNVRAVKYETDTYWNELCTSKYLINNATFPPYFTKRDEQVYVNTWHGTPLKKMGYHSNEGANGAKNIVRNFVQADFLVSPNEHTTDKMFRDAYRLDGIFSGKVIEQGYPRVDSQFATPSMKRNFHSRLNAHGITPGERKVVLYAPTWTGDSFHSPQNETQELFRRIRILDERFGDDYCFLLKVHQQVYAQAVAVPELRRFLVPNEIPSNNILAITDVLITNYSSIFFDFLALEKPIIFFAPDQAQYEDSRGLYFGDLPGPVVSDIEDLANLFVPSSVSGEQDLLPQYAQARKEARNTFCPKEDGGATKRLVDIVFNGNPDNLELINFEPTEKETILLYLGGMRNNGITTSALNLLQNIDYSRFDVSIWAPEPSAHSPQYLYDRIPSPVRQFLRQGSHPLTSDRNSELHKFLNATDFSEATIPQKAKEVFETEWRRSFGATEFDYIVDFSGYAGFWSFILLEGTARKSRSIWLHNDLILDRDREVDGKRPNLVPLGSVFNSYRFFDNLVSVSDDLREINNRNLRQYSHNYAFKSCHNSIDSSKVLRALSGSTEEIPLSSFRLDSSSIGVDSVVDDLLNVFSIDELQQRLERRSLHRKMFASSDVTRFVTAGRLSPEKNHARLLEAFAAVHDMNEKTELLILGDGALRSDLQSLAVELGVEQSVIFAGMVEDTLTIMKDCDCFVLSSDYEGQPMVILEASSVGIPVITVAFGSVRNSLGADRGIVVDQNVEGLVHGMLSFLNGDISTSIDFDVHEYNRNVMNEFYSSIGANA